MCVGGGLFGVCVCARASTCVCVRVRVCVCVCAWFVWGFLFVCLDSEVFITGPWWSVMQGLYDMNVEVSGIPLLSWEPPPLSDNVRVRSVLGDFTFHLSPRFCPSTAGCSPPSMSSFALCCFPVPGGSLLPCYINLPSSAWPSP